MITPEDLGLFLRLKFSYFGNLEDYLLDKYIRVILPGSVSLYTPLLIYDCKDTESKFMDSVVKPWVNDWRDQLINYDALYKPRYQQIDDFLQILIPLTHKEWKDTLELGSYYDRFNLMRHK